MHWIISAAGLAILFLLAWGTHRPAPRAYRDATLDDALPAHLKALAAETEGRGRTRIRMSRGLLGSLERSVRFLNALPSPGAGGNAPPAPLLVGCSAGHPVCP